MFVVSEIPDLFSDACIRDESGNLLFISLYGRDTALRQFQAALTLPANNPQSIRSFTLVRYKNLPETQKGHSLATAELKEFVSVAHADQLKSRSTRFANCLFGKNLAHMAIYNPCAIAPQKGSAWLIDVEADDARLTDVQNEEARRARLFARMWDTVMELSDIPLLDHWSDFILSSSAVSMHWADPRAKDCSSLGAVSAVKVSLAPDFENFIAKAVIDRQLLPMAAAR